MRASSNAFSSVNAPSATSSAKAAATAVRAEGVVEREGVGAEHHALGIERNPLLQDVFQFGGIDVIADEGRIGVDVFRGGQPDHFQRVWVAAVDQNEFCFGIARVAQNIFEVERVAIAQAEIIADADGGVEMDGQIELASLIDQHTKDVILEGAVVFVGRNAASA